jgi:hypothetical protein
LTLCSHSLSSNLPIIYSFQSWYVSSIWHKSRICVEFDLSMFYLHHNWFNGLKVNGLCHHSMDFNGLNAFNGLLWTQCTQWTMSYHSMDFNWLDFDIFMNLNENGLQMARFIHIWPQSQRSWWTQYTHKKHKWSQKRQLVLKYFFVTKIIDTKILKSLWTSTG